MLEYHLTTLPYVARTITHRLPLVGGCQKDARARGLGVGKACTAVLNNRKERGEGRGGGRVKKLSEAGLEQEGIA